MRFTVRGLEGSLDRDDDAQQHQQQRPRPTVADGLIALQRAAGNRAVGSLPAVQRQQGKAAGKAVRQKRGSVLVLGRFDRGIAELKARAELATGRRPIMLSELESQREMFRRFFPSGLASGTVVQEAVEGALDLRAIYLETAGVDLYRGGPLHRKDPGFHAANLGGQTAAEYRNLVSTLARLGHKVDVYIRHEGGLSVIGAGSQRVTGAPLPDELRPHLPPSMFPTPSGGGRGWARRLAAKLAGRIPRGALRGLTRSRLRGTVGWAAFTILIDVLARHIYEWTLEERLEELDRDVAALLEKRLPVGLALGLRNPEADVYANVVFRVGQQVQKSEFLGVKDESVLGPYVSLRRVFYDTEPLEAMGSAGVDSAPSEVRQGTDEEGGFETRWSEYELSIPLWRLLEEAPKSVADEYYAARGRAQPQRGGVAPREDPITPSPG